MVCWGTMSHISWGTLDSCPLCPSINLFFDMVLNNYLSFFLETIIIMVRTYKLKLTPRTSAEVMKTAVQMVLCEGLSVRQTAIDLEIPRATLTRYVKEARLKGVGEMTSFQKSKAHQQVFSPDQEQLLVSYLLDASRHHHGLTKRHVRQLAFQYATANHCSHPTSWAENNMAGEDWISGFLKRHRRLSCRKPEATSLSRGTSFNRMNVGKFFDNLEEVYKKHSFSAAEVWNMDETALTTVHKPPKVIGDRTARQIGQVTSAERGVLVTTICAVSAGGSFIPPMMIFPRVNFKPHMLNGAPPGTVGGANPSGWISTDLFLRWLQHFIDHTRATKEKPVLLLMDNHDSHISIEGIDLAKKNGVVLLTFPPHCSHKLQPLDVSVYSPLKRYYNDACNSWQLENPGQTITIYSIAPLLGNAFPRAMSPTSITSGFRKTGIWPYDRNVFPDSEFLGSFVTDRPAESTAQPDPLTESAGQTDMLAESSTHKDLLTGSVAERGIFTGSALQTNPGTSGTMIVTPEQVRPFPKAGPRTNSRKYPKKRSTTILTDTPNKIRMLEEAEEQMSKKQLKKPRKASITTFLYFR